jgi:hypothetical protein
VANSKLFSDNTVEFIICCFRLYLIASLIVSSEVRVEGLETLDYLDNLQNRERFTEQGDAITFESEVSLRYTLFFLSYDHLVLMLWLNRWTRYILALLQRLQFWIMKKREHL